VKPVRIKYYGLIWMTKQTYLILLAAFGGIACGALLIAYLADRLPPLGWPWVRKPLVEGYGFMPFFINNFYFIILVCLVAQTIDTLMVLHKFAQKEAEQRAQFEALRPEGLAAAPVPTHAEGIRPVPGVQPDRRASGDPHP